MAEEQSRGPQNGKQMSGTDKFMSKVKEMADTVDKTVSEQIESIKIKSKISNLNDEIDDFYRSIGIKVYQSAEENFVKSDFQAEIQSIGQRFDEIEQYLGLSLIHISLGQKFQAAGRHYLACGGAFRYHRLRCSGEER